MSSLLLIALSAVLVSMVAITGPGRWRPFADTADVYRNAVGVAQSLCVALPAIAAVTWLLARWILQPLDLVFLRTPVFVIVVLAIVPGIEIAMLRLNKLLPARPAYALLLTANSATLGIALLNEAQNRSFVLAMVFAIGAALLVSFLLLAFATMYERLRYADVPAPFREAPLFLITAGLMALAFMGFTGLIQE